MLKKILASLLLIVFLLTQSLSYASAQDTYPWYSQSYKQWYVKVYDENVSPPQEIFGERYTAAQVSWVIYSLVAFSQQSVGRLVACIWSGGVTQIGSCLYQNLPFPPLTENLQPKRESVFAALFPEDRQLSFVNYIRQGARDLSLTPTAYAQETGFGFQALGPVQNIWRTIRDITYGFFVIIIIIFAFMIMFRTKINPQTVVTIQSALPKIIITLILVTFSYAIAGLLIDLSYVVIGLVALIVSQAGFINPPDWNTAFNLLTDGPQNTAGGYTGILGWFIVYGISFWASLAGVVSSIGDLFEGSILAQGVAGFLAFFINVGVTIWMIVTVGKIFILLIKTYVSILIQIIFSPILIGFGSLLPAGGFGSWVKGLISNLLVYPLAGILLFLSILFLGATYPAVRTTIADGLRVQIADIFDTGTNASYWYPPLTLGTQGDGTGNWDPLPILWLFASLGILTMIPHVANIAKGLMTGRMPEKTSDMEAVTAAGLGYAAGAAGRGGRFVGGGALDAALTGITVRGKSIEGLGQRASRWQGSSNVIAKWAGRQVYQVGERRGIMARGSSGDYWSNWKKRGEK